MRPGILSPAVPARPEPQRGQAAHTGAVGQVQAAGLQGPTPATPLRHSASGIGSFIPEAVYKSTDADRLPYAPWGNYPCPTMDLTGSTGEPKVPHDPAVDAAKRRLASWRQMRQPVLLACQ